MAEWQYLTDKIRVWIEEGNIYSNKQGTNTPKVAEAITTLNFIKEIVKKTEKLE